MVFSWLLRVLVFVLNTLMHAFVVHCFVNFLINLLMNAAWKLKSVYNYMDIYFKHFDKYNLGLGVGSVCLSTE